MSKVLVVPTIRQESITKFIDQWQARGELFNRIIIVEDNPEKTFVISDKMGGAVIEHLCWKDIDQELGDKAWIISRRDSAIRSFGFYRAWQTGCDYIFTLDDDCYPIDPWFTSTHLWNLNDTPAWSESILNYRTRGLPYDNTGSIDNVKLSVGLWTDIPDLNAIQMFTEHQEDYTPPKVTRVMPIGQYFPICGMNMAFKREITPLTYFPLMGEGYPYRRFDDIWFGVICKKIMDHLNLLITCGEPFVRHMKASDKFANLEKEAPGMRLNEDFWWMVDQIDLHGKDCVACMKEIGQGLEKQDHAYVQKLGKAIQIWASLF